MLELLIGIVVSIITQIAKKSGISARWIVLGLAIICGAFYYFVSVAYKEEANIIWKHVLEVYGISQIIYNYAIRYFENKNE